MLQQFFTYNLKHRYKRKHLAERRNSRPQVLCEIGVLRNLVKFTRKHLCQSLLFNKFAGLRLFTTIFF